MPHLFNIKTSGVLSDRTTFARQMTGAGAILETNTLAQPLSTSYRRLGAFTLTPAESSTSVCGLYINLSNIKPTSTLNLFLSSNGNTTLTSEYVLSSLPALSTYSESFYIGLMFDPITFAGLGTSLIVNVSARTSELSGAYYIGTPSSPTGDFNRALISTVTLPISTALAAEKVNIISHLYNKNATTYGELSGSGSSNVVNISGERCVASGSIVLHGDSKIEVVDVQGGRLDNTNAEFLILNNSSSFIAGSLQSPLTSTFLLNLSGAVKKNVRVKNKSNFIAIGKDILPYTHFIEDTKANISSISSTNLVSNISSWSVGDKLLFLPNTTESNNSTVEKIITVKNNNGITLNSPITSSKLSLNNPLYGPNFNGAPILNVSRNIVFGPNAADVDSTIIATESSNVYIKNSEICNIEIYNTGSVLLENNTFINGDTTANTGSNPITISTNISLNAVIKKNIFYKNNRAIYLINGNTTNPNLVQNLEVDSNVFLNSTTHAVNFAVRSFAKLQLTNNILCGGWGYRFINESNIVSKFYNNTNYYITGASLVIDDSNINDIVFLENFKTYKVINGVTGYPGRGLHYFEGTGKTQSISAKNISIIDCVDFALLAPSKIWGKIDGLITRDNKLGILIKSTSGPVDITNLFSVRNNKTTYDTNHKSTNLVYEVGDCQVRHSVRNAIIGSAEDMYGININKSNFLERLSLDNCNIVSSNTNIFLCPEGFPNHKTLIQGNIICSNSNFYTPTKTVFSGETSYSKENGGSLYFDGTNYIKALSGNHFDFGTGDFTIDGWLNVDDTVSIPTVFDTRSTDTSKTPFYFGINRSWYPEIKIGEETYTSNLSLFKNLWSHVVISRTSGVFNLWLNGKKSLSFTNSSNLNSANFTVGASYDGNDLFSGYIFNFRVTKGQSLYNTNSNFDLPPTPENSSDNTSLLLASYKHNQVLDSLSKNEPYTLNNVVSTTVNKKFGKGSVYFDGDNYSVIEFDKINDFSVGTSNFTIETWVYSENYSNPSCIFDIRSTTNSVSGFYLAENGEGYIISNGVEDFIVTTNNRKPNEWQHIALVRNANTLTLFVDGMSAKGGSFELTDENFTDSNLIIGGYVDNKLNGYVFNGYMDNFLFVNGSAKYTQDFTPSNIIKNDAEASLLTLNESSFKDSTSNNSQLTIGTTTNIIAASPNYENNNYDESIHYGSLYFDSTSTNTSIEIPYVNTSFDWWTEDYTLEFFIKIPTHTSVSITDTKLSSLTNKNASIVIGNMSNDTLDYVWSFGPQLNGIVSFVYLAKETGTNKAQRVDSTEKINLNSWNHLALVKNSSGIRIYVNGVGSGLSAIPANHIPESNPSLNLVIGQHRNIKLPKGTIISNLRIVKGTALYSGNTISIPTSGLSNLPNTKLLIKSTNSGIIDSSGNTSLLLDGATTTSTRNLMIDTSKTTYGTNVPIKNTKAYAVYDRVYDVKEFCQFYPNAGASVEFISPFNKTTYNRSTHGYSLAFNLSSSAVTNPTNYGITNTQNTNFGTGNFVIDFFIYPIVNQIGTIFDMQNSAASTTGFRFGSSVAGNLMIFSGTAAQAINPSEFPTLGKWTHIAVSRTGNVMKIHKDGVALPVTWTLTTQSFTDTTLQIGSPTFRGYISNFRIRKNVGDEVISPANIPTTPFDTLATYNLTRIGAAKEDTLSPFNTIPYDVQLHGTSMSLNINAAANHFYKDTSGDLSLDANNFVIDFFIYPISSDPGTIFDMQNSAASTTGFRFGASAAGNLMIHSAGAVQALNANQFPTLYTWTHIAISRTGNVMKIHKDGVALPVTWTLTTQSFTDTTLQIGSGTFKGYISNFRIRKNVGEEVISPENIPQSSLPDNTECDVLINTIHSDDIIQSTYSPLTSNIVYFDGNSSILAYQETPAFKLKKTDPITIQMWVKFDDIGTERCLLDFRSSGTDTTRLSFYRSTANKICLNSNANKYTGNKLLVQNTWYHIALVVEQDFCYVYINGLLDGSFPNTYEFYRNEINPFVIGSTCVNASFMKGHISNLRITKKAEYSGNFIPPTEDILDVDNNTLFLLNHNTNTQNYYAVDKTANTIFSNEYGIVAGVSGRFSENSGIRIKNSMLMANNYLSAYDLGADNATSPMQQFCLEFWFYNSEASNANYKTLFQKNGGANGGWAATGSEVYIFLQNNSVGIQYNASTVQSIGKILNNATLPLNTTISSYTWNHFAFTCDGTTYRGYLNGTIFGSSTSKMLKQTSPQTSLGFGSHVPVGITANQFDGVMSDIRLTKGAARYTEPTYIVPSAPFDLNSDPNAANVVMLVNSENVKSYTINDIIDSSDNNNQILFESGVSQTKITPFETNGWSGYFDGTANSSITTPSNSNYFLGTDVFTLECWFYPYTPPPAAAEDYAAIIDYRILTNFINGFTIGYKPTTKTLSMYGIHNTTNTPINDGDIIENDWNHLVFVKTSPDVSKIFLNGIQVGDDIKFASNYTAQSFTIGNTLAADTIKNPFYGLISNFRLIKGVSLYHTNFTPNKNKLTTIVSANLDINNSKLLIDSESNASTMGDVILDLSKNNLTITKTNSALMVENYPYDITTDSISKTVNVSEYQSDVFRDKGIVFSYIEGSAKKHAKFLNAGTISTDETNYRNSNVGFSEKLTPNSKKTPLRSSSKLIALRAYDSTGSFRADILSKVSVWVKKSSNWSGESPKLIVVENRSMGINDDTILAVADGPNNTWIKLESTNIGSIKKNGMLEFYVECEGVNVGSIWIDDWSQDII
jgi:hypothetical protein